MKRNDRKKAAEKWWLDRAREHIPSFPAGTVEPHEGPDFLIRDGGTIIGVEMVRVYSSDAGPVGPPPIDRQKFRNLFEDELARRIASNLGRAAFRVSCTWTSSGISVSGGAPALVDAVLPVVLQEIHSAHGEMNWIVPWERLPDRFRDGLGEITVSYLAGLTQSHGAHTEAAFIPPSAPSLRAVLSKKGALHAMYRKKCDRLVLVAYATGESLVAELDVSEISNIVFESDYDRAFAFDWFSKLGSELHLMRGP